jgi:hypothetical protein
VAAAVVAAAQELLVKEVLVDLVLLIIPVKHMVVLAAAAAAAPALWEVRALFHLRLMPMVVTAVADLPPLYLGLQTFMVAAVAGTVMLKGILLLSAGLAAQTLAMVEKSLVPGLLVQPPEQQTQVAVAVAAAHLAAPGLSFSATSTNKGSWGNGALCTLR